MLVDKRLYRTSAVLLVDERLRDYSAVPVPHFYNCAARSFKGITLTPGVPLGSDRNTTPLFLIGLIALTKNRLGPADLRRPLG